MRLFVSLLLAVCLGAVAAEHPSFSSPSLYDIIKSSRCGAAARASSAQHRKTKKSCLQLQQTKNCRVTGGQVVDPWEVVIVRPPICEKFPCSIEDVLDPAKQKHPRQGLPSVIAGGYLETDFSCCNDHKEHNHQSISNLAANPKVGGCEWTFSLLTDYIGSASHFSEFDLAPVEGSTWLKFGPASGVCSMNAHSERCEGPFCDDMTITMQGALYAALAISPDTSATQLNVPKGDTCEAMQIAISEVFGPMAVKEELEKAMQERRRLQNECRQVCWRARANGTQASRDGAGGDAQVPKYDCGYCGSLTGLLWDTIFGTAYNSKLLSIAQEKWAGSTPDESSNLNGGLAFIFMGQTTLSSMKGGLQVEETGQLEYPAVFIPFSFAKGVPFDPDLVMVKGGNMKLWTSEEGHYSA